MCERTVSTVGTYVPNNESSVSIIGDKAAKNSKKSEDISKSSSKMMTRCTGTEGTGEEVGLKTYIENE